MNLRKTYSGADSQGTTISIIAFLAVVVFVFSASFGQFAHNHPADFKDHKDCPAHLLFELLSFVLLVFFFFSFRLNNVTNHLIVLHRHTLQVYKNWQCDRAPPLFSF